MWDIFFGNKIEVVLFLVWGTVVIGTGKSDVLQEQKKTFLVG